MSGRTGYHKAIEHGVWEYVLKQDKEAIAIASEAVQKLKSGFFPERLVNMFYQDGWWGGNLDLVDGWTWAVLWNDFCTGNLLFKYIMIGEEPGKDGDPRNSEIIASLSSKEWCEFSRSDDKAIPGTGGIKLSGNCSGGPGGDNDGNITWQPPMMFERYEMGTITNVAYDGHPTVCLEVGSTKLTTTWFHLSTETGLARWPYGSKEIGIFVRPFGWKNGIDQFFDSLPAAKLETKPKQRKPQTKSPSASRVDRTMVDPLIAEIFAPLVSK